MNLIKLNNNNYINVNNIETIRDWDGVAHAHMTNKVGYKLTEQEVMTIINMNENLIELNSDVYINKESIVSIQDDYVVTNNGSFLTVSNRDIAILLTSASSIRS